MSESLPRQEETDCSSTTDDKEVTEPKYRNRGWLKHKYEFEGLTTREIATICGCNKQTISNWLHKHGIGTRSVGNQKGITFGAKDNRLLDGEWLEQKYHKEGLSTIEIGEMVGMASPSVLYWIKKHGIRVKDHSEYKLPSEENHWKWSGGHEDYYGPNWQRQRQRAIERDNGKCKYCGVHRSELDHNIHVHHIIPRKDFIEDGKLDYKRANDLDNLITLCISCHRKWEGLYLKPDVR